MAENTKGGMARFLLGRKADRDRLLAALPGDGTFRTNKDVRDELNLSEDRYWEVRDQLVEEGKIIKNRGQGGRIALNLLSDGNDKVITDKEEAKTEISQEIKKAAEEIKEEHALYEPFAKSIGKRAKDEGAENTVVEITARQGKRQTGGEWSRPDVCQVSVRNLRYLGQKVVEVTTFEIKTADCDVRAVYEALSHSRRAHRSYLAIYLPTENGDIQERLDRIKAECARSGVGLLRFAKPDDLSTFVTVVEPRANWVDLSEVDEFISTQITDKEKIRDWL
jgi:hypothetical protein